MSRCLPYPQPGYVKKPRDNNLDFLKGKKGEEKKKKRKRRDSDDKDKRSSKHKKHEPVSKPYAEGSNCELLAPAGEGTHETIESSKTTYDTKLPNGPAEEHHRASSSQKPPAHKAGKLEDEKLVLHHTSQLDRAKVEAVGRGRTPLEEQSAVDEGEEELWFCRSRQAPQKVSPGRVATSPEVRKVWDKPCYLAEHDTYMLPYVVPY